MSCLTIIAFSFAACTAAFAQTAEQAEKALQQRRELDEVRWSDPAKGPAFKAAIIKATDAGLEVRKVLPTGVLTRVLPYDTIGGIKLGLTMGERQLISEARPEAAPAIRIFWEARKKSLKLQGSNAGDFGLALCRALRAAGKDEVIAEAVVIARDVAENDANPKRRTLGEAESATLEFLQTMRTSPPEDVEKRARTVTEASDTSNPDLMLLLTSFLMKKEFAALKQIETENPRWMEDEEVKPQREKHYHLALDFALYPSLFHPLHEGAAADGLWQAVEIYQYAAQKPLMQSALEDLVTLYPQSSYTARAQALLTPLKASMTAAAAPAVDAKAAADKPAAVKAPEPPPPPPPAPKKHNLFED